MKVIKQLALVLVVGVTLVGMGCGTEQSGSLEGVDLDLGPDAYDQALTTDEAVEGTELESSAAVKCLCTCGTTLVDTESTTNCADLNKDKCAFKNEAGRFEFSTYTGCASLGVPVL